MTSAKDLTTATPADIDKQLAQLAAQLFKAESKLPSLRDSIHRAAGDRSNYQGRRQVWGMDFNAAQQAAQHRADTDTTYIGRDARNALQRLQDAEKSIAAIEAEQAPYDAEFARRGGWTRAFIVTNVDGHVHKTMDCSTCRPSTQFAWLTDYSGGTEQQVVEDAGERACTVCYPSAPVDIRKRPTKIFTPDEIAASEARAAKAKAAEAAKVTKAAKAITDPEGNRLQGKGRGDWIDTEAAAQSEAVDALVTSLREAHIAAILAAEPDLAFYFLPAEHRARLLAEDVEFADRLVVALAAKRGQGVTEVRDSLEAKAIAKYKRLNREAQKDLRQRSFSEAVAYAESKRAKGEEPWAAFATPAPSTFPKDSND
ncbi:hypothetical protein [Kitasatospora viridis]|uniref:Uncharacterized protein n=1 Tax=Kitasatospora viridis TaxID=281105 RepID=A0A561SA65_9ACTN|nr:hypothetical protein [Kitasatospora viridis]TWF71768.1 hypothetical protein FHX73_18139 [Kitasatospora viridis]